MAHESFEDNEVAEVLNKYFVCIKVDREERPDIDSVYMNVAHRITGQGGWPLTVIMTAEQKPFFVGTYFPKKSRFNIKGLLEILDIVKNKWEGSRDEIIKSSDKITDLIRIQEESEVRKTRLSIDVIYSARDLLEKSFDKKYGGFGNSPKFPTPSNLLFLLRYYEMEKDNSSLGIVEKTLEGMYRGGIYDHVGFGFSRYSTDNKWLVPHFEKMLYDNAQLVIAYTEAFLATKNSLYRRIAENSIDYVLREMADEKGGFYSAQDADSEGEEGKYYVFAYEEIINILGKDDGNYFNDYFGITKKGNFEGKNIPNLLKNDEYFKTDDKINDLIKKIYDYRLARTRLHKDDKILTSWNCMMIAALAKAYRAFGNERYLSTAENALKFIKKSLIDEDNKISVRYRDGEVLNSATLDDYAFYVWALLEMYEATYEAHYLKRAVKFNSKMIKLFWDAENGGFFMTANDGERLIYRPKELYDGAVPSGNSVAAYNLVRLSKITGSIELEELSHEQVQLLTNYVSDYPAGYTFALISLIYELYHSKEIICIAKDKKDIRVFMDAVNGRFLANTSTVAVCRDEVEELSEAIEFIKNYDLKDGKTTYYVCENRECSLPFTNIEELLKVL